MKNSIISVVIPIYNIQDYLERCIKSIVHQTYQDLEIILVDDGSTDNCPVICDQWGKKDHRIKVIHKQNAGLGMARNEGIEHATGEFICFFDGDDYIAEDLIEKAYGMIMIEKADMVTFGYNRVSSSGTIKASVIPKVPYIVYTGDQIRNEFIPNMLSPNPKTGENQNLWMSACSSLYSMKFVQNNNWKFVSERKIISEDIYSLIFLYSTLNKVVILQEALYYYCENNSSLTHVYRSDRFDKNNYFYDSCLRACMQLELGEKICQRVSYPYLSNTIMALKLIKLSELKRKERMNAIKKVILDSHFQEVIAKKDNRVGSFGRKLFLYFASLKMYRICSVLLKLQTRKD